MSAANTAQTKNLRITKTDSYRIWRSSVDVCCCLMDLDLHALMHCKVIGAHMLSNITTTIHCSRNYFNYPNLKSTCLLDHYTSHMLILGPSTKWKESACVSRVNYSILQFRKTQNRIMNQVYEAVYSLNSKPELKQDGLGICCPPPSFYWLCYFGLFQYLSRRLLK